MVIEWPAVVEIQMRRSKHVFFLVAIVSSAPFILASVFVYHFTNHEFIEFRSSGNIVQFGSSHMATRAAKLCLVTRVSPGINLSITGQYSGQGRLTANQTSFVVGLEGKVRGSSLDAKGNFPFSEREFTILLRNELAKRLSLQEAPHVIELQLDWAPLCRE